MCASSQQGENPKILQIRHKSNTSHVQTPQNIQPTDDRPEELSCF